MEFIFNEEGILSTITIYPSVTLDENPENWQEAGDVIIVVDESYPPEGHPFSFVEHPDGHTEAIYDAVDVREFFSHAPIDSVYYLQPDLVNRRISLWVKKEDGWHPGVIEMRHNSQRRRMNEPTKVSSSNLFNTIKETNENRESFVLFYQTRVEDRVELCEREIKNPQELVDIIFNQNVVSIKYFLARYHHILTVSYSRVDKDGWKRLV